MALVLVVDDSWVARLGMSKLILSLGHRVEEAENGTLALQMLEEKKYDIIFLDLLMPGLEGQQILQILKEKNNRVPVVVLSADIQETTKEQCFALGATAFLRKPPQKTELETLFKNIK